MYKGETRVRSCSNKKIQMPAYFQKMVLLKESAANVSAYGNIYKSCSLLLKFKSGFLVVNIVGQCFCNPKIIILFVHITEVLAFESYIEYKQVKFVDVSLGICNTLS